jgi:hypothetical protein
LSEKYINKIGLEVEGGWGGERGIAPFDDLDLTADRSIDGTMMRTDRAMTSVHVGEAVSEPIDREAVDEWINKYWPTEANITCGYHIHVSFRKPFWYTLCTRKSFFLHLLAKVEAKMEEIPLGPRHYLRRRLQGQNVFCNMDFDAAGQIRVQERRIVNRVRYGALNFAHGLHGTMEFRLYPTFRNKKEARIFTHVYLDAINEYLDAATQRSWVRSFSLLEKDGKNVIKKGVV